MEPKKIKKLQLKKEQVSNLSRPDMKNIHGKEGFTTVCTDGCTGSDWFCTEWNCTYQGCTGDCISYDWFCVGY